MITEDKILAFLKKNPRGSRFSELVKQFTQTPVERRILPGVLKGLAKAGLIVRLPGRVYQIFPEQDQIVGQVRKHRNGFAFVIPEDKGRADIYLNRREASGLMEGDRVSVMEINRRGGKLKTGKVLSVLERGRKHIVGVFEQIGKRFFLREFGTDKDIPFRNRIAIKPSLRLSAKTDHVVVATITKFPTEWESAQGKVEKVLGHYEDPSIDTDIIMAKYALPSEFSQRAEEEAEKASLVDISGEVGQREDLRSIPTVTIDGENAKDFDDAISVEKTSKGHFLLRVSIADVSFYVKPNSILDQEARLRGTSVYFADRCIPMLPEVLSNGLCSLKPKEDRLAVTCEMEFNLKGELLRYDLYESVIRSLARLTYTQVQHFFDTGKTQPKLASPVESLLLDAHSLHERLRAKRRARGGLDFDLPEPELILNAQGNAEDIIRAPRYPSHMLIEDFMIAANETVATHLEEQGFPCLYRVHPPVKEEDLKPIYELAKMLGIKVSRSHSLHQILLSFLRGVQGKNYERFFNYLLLRSLKVAFYDSKNIGHFGLASPKYCHFTSPIRRYPDLVAHRLLKRLKKKGSPADAEKRRLMEQELSELGAHCSERERLADDAEREVVALKKAAFMEKHLGEVSKGHLAGVSRVGLFVELERWFVEGVIPLRSLVDDWYALRNDFVLLQGESTGRRFCLGDAVSVQVVRVNREKREIDLELVEGE